MSNAKTFDIYVASYHRWDTTEVYKHLEYCTYVVRKTEEPYYAALGVKTWAIEDELINSFVKVQNYIIKNSNADIVCVLDDDIGRFFYRLDKNEVIKDKSVITAELERMGQLCLDLDVGLLGSPITAIPYSYQAEFNFSGMIGPIRIYNREKVKAVYNQMPFFTDTDFVLQELLLNRIILRPNYLVTNAKLETNKGGMNIKRTRQMQIEHSKKMKEKWGKYFSYNPNKNISKVLVQR